MYLTFKLLSKHYLLKPNLTYLTYIQHVIEYRTHVATDDTRSRIMTGARVEKIIAGKHLKKKHLHQYTLHSLLNRGGIKIRNEIKLLILCERKLEK